jgi:hypothetical protein
MPFTLSHPAAIAPLRSLARGAGLPLAALAVGAMAPDLEFFLWLRPKSLWSHSLLGLLAFCLPMGLLLVLAWETLVRAPLRDLLALPEAPEDRSRLARRPAWWVRAAAGVLLGAITHFVWDGVTHAGGWALRLVPALGASAFSARGHDVPWFNLVQHASTVAGGLVVLGWLWRELQRAGAPAVISRSPRRIGALAGTLAVASAFALWNGWRLGVADGYWPLEATIGRAAVGGVFGLGVALALYGVAHRLLAGDPPAQRAT